MSLFGGTEMSRGGSEVAKTGKGDQAVTRRSFSLTVTRRWTDIEPF
jgi:hypothetical protein